jgi:hypothetical protein
MCLAQWRNRHRKFPIQSLFILSIKSAKEEIIALPLLPLKRFKIPWKSRFLSFSWKQQRREIAFPIILGERFREMIFVFYLRDPLSLLTIRGGSFWGNAWNICVVLFSFEILTLKINVKIHLRPTAPRHRKLFSFAMVMAECHGKWKEAKKETFYYLSAAAAFLFLLPRRILLCLLWSWKWPTRMNEWLCV